MDATIFNKNIVIISQQPWDTEIGSNCKDLALELSKHTRVLYVNSPLDRISSYRKRSLPTIQRRLRVIKGEENGLVLIKENLWNFYPDCIVESINWMNNRHIFDFFNKINNKSFASSIKKALKVLDFQDFYLFNDSEIFKAFYLSQLLKPTLSIYYSRDYMIGVEYWKKHGVRLEAELISQSSLCVANSEYLADYCRKFNSNSFNVGQGAELDGFHNISLDRPLDLPSEGSKIVGYVGALNSLRLDIETLEWIGISFPDVTIVLIGQEDDLFRSSRLHGLSNILFLGQKPVDQLPVYIKAFDVCINPQLINELTIGNYPRKIDEYMALGKPIVATKTKTMESFGDLCYLAATKEEFVEGIILALSEDSESLRNRRINSAYSHTWANSLSRIDDSIALTVK